MRPLPLSVKHNLARKKSGAWQIFRGERILGDKYSCGARLRGFGFAEPPSFGNPSMNPLPPLSPQALREARRGTLEALCDAVAAAVNQAPPGHVLNQSEEPVRDVLGDFRQAVYQTAVPLRLAAAEAAFSPARPAQRPASGK